MWGVLKSCSLKQSVMPLSSLQKKHNRRLIYFRFTQTSQPEIRREVDSLRRQAIACMPSLEKCSFEQVTFNHIWSPCDLNAFELKN